jgi:hypothetical protein
MQPKITNTAWPKVAANPARPRTVNLAQHGGAANPMRPRVADPVQPGAASLAQPRAVNSACLGEMVDPA